MPTLPQLVQQNELPAYIELFEIDVRKILGIEDNPNAMLGRYFITPSTDNPVGITTSEYSKVINGSSVTFGEQTYMPYPIQLVGLEDTVDGAPARPTLHVSNIDKFFGELSFLYGDLVGAKVTYIRTFEEYLASGIGHTPITFTIGKKTSHNVNAIVFELRSRIDNARLYMPKNQMLRDPHADGKVYYPGLGLSKYIG